MLRNAKWLLISAKQLLINAKQLLNDLPLIMEIDSNIRTHRIWRNATQLHRYIELSLMLENYKEVSVKILSLRWNLSEAAVVRFLKSYADLCPDFKKIANVRNDEVYLRPRTEEPQEPAPAKKEPAAEVIEPEVVAPAKAAPQPAKKQEAKPQESLAVAAKEVFLRCYQELFGIAYYWDTQSAVGMRNLLTRIRYTLSEDHSDFTDQEVLDNLETLLQNVTDPWVMNHFNPNILVMKYNLIINQIRNGGKDYKQLQHERKLAERMQRFSSGSYDGGGYERDPDILRRKYYR